MSISELTDRVAKICKENGVKRLDLFGSFATGTAEFLLEDIQKYGKQIY